jgi:hypothetical protein
MPLSSPAMPPSSPSMPLSSPAAPPQFLSIPLTADEARDSLCTPRATDSPHSYRTEEVHIEGHDI